MSTYNTPLENLYPDIFGDLDDGQETLIRNGSTSLVITENASEFVSRMKDLPNFMENILSTIKQENHEKYSIYCETFPSVIKDKWFKKYRCADYIEHYGRGKLTATYNNIIRKTRPNKIPKNAVLHMAIDLESVGHYGVAIKNEDRVIVFDSMQMNKMSVYTAMFSQIAEDIFGVEPVVLDTPSALTCPQATGGYVEEKQEGESTQNYLCRLQNLDSQNHFCYMWAIWYFHMFLTQGEKGISTVFDTLYRKNIHPLICIKRYMWSIIYYLYKGKEYDNLISVAMEAKGKDKDFLARFFTDNFKYVWDDQGTGKFKLYPICSDYENVMIKNVNDCISYSIN